MTYDTIQEIKNLPHFRDLKCPQCGTNTRVHALQIYAHCPQCGTKYKYRGYGAIGAEIQDVVDAVLEWAGEGETFDAVLERHRQTKAGKDD